MSFITPNIDPAPADVSGEKILFALAAAFGVSVAAIIVGAFLPVGLGVVLVFVVLAVVMAVVGAFLARVLGGDGDGH